MVDDERTIADTLAVILNQRGYEASIAYDGTEAIEAARRFQPDLIISDVVMPDMNGIEVAIRIHEFLPDSKILLFSGQATTTDLLDDARKNGHEFDCVPKPLHPKELLLKIEE